jgi:hypothetical protein
VGRAAEVGILSKIHRYDEGYEIQSIIGSADDINNQTRIENRIRTVNPGLEYIKRVIAVSF